MRRQSARDRDHRAARLRPGGHAVHDPLDRIDCAVHRLAGPLDDDAERLDPPVDRALAQIHRSSPNAADNTIGTVKSTVGKPMTMALNPVMLLDL